MPSHASASPVPHDSTARRLEWAFLPPNLRGWFERKCGSPVVEAISQDSGFTPGFASVLVCQDGSRHFAKAASVKAQRLFADSYREEARKLAALPASAPAPRLLHVLDDDWVALVIEYADARMPSRPWNLADLDATLDTLEVLAEELTPAPAHLELDGAVDDFAAMLDGWAKVREELDLPYADEAEALAGRYAAVVDGDTVVHTDVRSDNVLIGADGRAMLCDWNWPVRGCDWFDSFATLIAPRGEGLDVDAVMASRRLLKDVPPDDVDTVLALLVGYFLGQSVLPVPATSPHIRDHQRWQGEVCWTWLAERRGWGSADERAGH